jgi:hypothetical protein
MLRNLKAKMIERNVSVEDISSVIGKCTRIVKGKIREETPLTIPEGMKIRSSFFPGTDWDTLFASDGDVPARKRRSA